MTDTIKENKIFGNLFNFTCVAVGATLWILIVVAEFVVNKTNLLDLPEPIAKYGAFAVLLLPVIELVAKFTPSFGTRFRDTIIKLLFLIELALPVIALYKVYPTLQPAFTIAQAIAQVRDSTNKAKAEFDVYVMFKNCQEAGMSINRYKQDVTERILDRNSIPNDLRATYKQKIDSAVGNPATEICSQVNKFNQLRYDIYKLIEKKDIAGIDMLFRKYNIPESAKAVLLSGNDKLGRGPLKDYLTDVIQELKPMFTEIRCPGKYSSQFIIDQIIFV